MPINSLNGYGSSSTEDLPQIAGTRYHLALLGEGSSGLNHGQPRWACPGGCQLAVMNQLGVVKGTGYANALLGEPLD